MALAAMPVSELRGAIPVGVLFFDQPAVVAGVYGFLGNLIPVPFILFALDPVSRWMRSHSRIMDRFFERLFSRTMTRHGRRFERFRDLALITLVAIPLPLTGAWTGSLCAFLFGVPIKRALPLVILGVAIAAAVVTAVVATGQGLFGVRTD